MAIVTLDFETYYSQDYSLQHMTTAEYILDPRFQLIMCAVKVGDASTETLVGEAAIRARLDKIDWDKTALLAHHAAFDGGILLWRLGITPAMYLCSLSMSRAITHWVVGRSSLAHVSKYLGLPPKGSEVVMAKGKRLEAFAPDELSAYIGYCVLDTENCRAIFDRLRPSFEGSELRLIDMVVRMQVQPQVTLNPNVLAEHLAAVQSEKAQVLGQVAHLDPGILSSQPKFAKLLESYGVDVPMKLSPTTGEMIPALAKNDRGFRELQQDTSQPMVVQALLAARVKAKSTIEETRTERFLKTSLMTWPYVGRGWAPVPVKYYGARTGRLSGDDFTNWQNIRQGSRIREAIEAPPGMRIVHRDSSQIEARMVAWLARCQALLVAFEQGRDVYSEFASVVYGVPVTAADKLRRFVGKTAILGLGYGCGPDKFRHMLFIGSRGVSMNVEEEAARRIVYTYRDGFPQIPMLWLWGSHFVDCIVSNSGRPSNNNSLPTSHSWIPIDIGYDSAWLPNGMCLSYPDITYRYDNGETNVMYRRPYGDDTWAKLYGAKFIENISQALARIVVTDIAVRVYDLTGMHPFLTTHDSLDYCVPEDEVQWWDAMLTKEFTARPTWAPDLPLASEGGWGRNLLDAERGVNQ